MFFASDNAGPAHPQVMEALLAANTGHARPYGNDDLSRQAVEAIHALFEAPQASVHLVATGTAANALSLAALTPPWGTAFCADLAHVEEDECNAPEFFSGGAKLSPVATENAKITPEALKAALARRPKGDVHVPQPSALTLTQATERGTLYTLAELAALTALARENGLATHLDGARFANACAALGCTPAEMTWKAGIDAVSFGGTKNGLLGVEAVIFFDLAHDWELALRRKRAAHLFSKHRFLAAQMLAYLQGGLWLEMAQQANEKAARLAKGLRACPQVTLTHSPEVNMIFARFPAALHTRLQAAGAVYSASETAEGEITARFVTDWSLPEAEIDRFLALL
ncbi:threonine aldolase family protein [Pseudoruegeria sp. SHC-113]|uniref:threonine aldolase family protein n=1 Tax=Pseudoruegeria sp. SHC-113 TaxID=2855439 RepID=UPI0021BB7D7C|nr:beta-eliminating lyase-related protein [Pseudoruegeria sp. SHC-113]MCT8159622.1 low specificity L-threonine aldolase [Pseudoruegeria sp. SHC-113]